jgi:hypothetical protein
VAAADEHRADVRLRAQVVSAEARPPQPLGGLADLTPVPRTDIRMVDDGSVSDSIDPDLDCASYYRDGRDPDRDCERLYHWHRALWGRGVPGVRPFVLDVIYDRGYGLRLRGGEDLEIRLCQRQHHPHVVDAELDQEVRS